MKSRKRFLLRVILALAVAIGLDLLAFAQSSVDSWSEATAAGQRALPHSQFGQAEAAFSSALQIAEKLPPNDPRLVTSLNNLARAYFYEAKYADAEKLYLRSLATIEASHGPYDSALVPTLDFVAQLYGAQGNYKLAEQTAQRALGIRQKSAQPDDQIAAGLRSLARYYWLDFRPASTPGVGFTTSSSINNLPVGNPSAGQGGRYVVSGDSLISADLPPIWDYPAPELVRVVTTGQRATDSPRVEKQKIVKAEALDQQALALLEKTYGPQNRALLPVLLDLGQIQKRAGKYAEAAATLKRGFDFEESSARPTGFAGNFGQELAAVDLQLHNYSEAASAAGTVVSIRENYGMDSMTLYQPLRMQAEALSKLGRKKEAREVEKRADGIGEKHGIRPRRW